MKVKRCFYSVATGTFWSSTTGFKTGIGSPVVVTTRSFVVSSSCKTVGTRRTAPSQSRFFASTTPEEFEETFATSYHSPVMCQECIDALMDCQRSVHRTSFREEEDEEEPLIFVDGTLGGGGHSAALLERLQPGDIVIGCDVDSDALDAASQRLQTYMEYTREAPLFIPVQSNFCELDSVLPKLKHPRTQEPLLQQVGVDGILLDLGVSSHQIDNPERGFAFLKDGPLDMRMNPNDSRLTAADIVNEFDQQELQTIFSRYGDEPRAKTIANAIVNHRPMTTTADLVEAISAVTPEYSKHSKRLGRTASLARVFQSLRIVVNQEDKVLEEVLTRTCPTLLRPGGRLVVLSYHSKEDRPTKRIMRDGDVHGVAFQDRDVYGNYVGHRPFKPVGKRRKASKQEIEVNPRARSATLRIAERLID